MKTLYESILDDEEVLIDDVKKSVNDPIVGLYHIFLKNKTLKNNREVNNIIQELSKSFKLEESRIEMIESVNVKIQKDLNQVLFFICLTK